MSKMGRRILLKGASAAIALPFLEAMMPSRARAAAVAPLRIGTFYFPAGVHNKGWRPLAGGPISSLPTNLTALNTIKDRVVLMSGLGAFGHGQGSHMIGAPMFMGNDVIPGCNSYTNRNRESADIAISNYINQQLGLHQPLILKSGTAAYDEYACYPHGGESWINPAGAMTFSGSNTATSAVQSPQVLFDRLFAGANSNTTDALSEYRRARKQSVLDSVLGPSTSLLGRLGRTDRAMMDQFFTSLRDVEKRISAIPTPKLTCQAPTRPSAGLSFEEEVRVYVDLCVLAMACDRTRVVSYVMDAETGSNPRQFSWLGVSQGHHQLSHDAYGGDSNAINAMNKITAWYAEIFKYMLTKMMEYQEGDKDLLYNSVIVFGTGMGDVNGEEHDQTNISLILGGELGGTIKTGQAHTLQRVRTPNLWLTLMQKFGLGTRTYSYSDGTINL